MQHVCKAHIYFSACSKRSVLFLYHSVKVVTTVSMVSSRGRKKTALSPLLRRRAKPSSSSCLLRNVPVSPTTPRPAADSIKCLTVPPEILVLPACLSSSHSSGGPSWFLARVTMVFFLLQFCCRLTNIIVAVQESTFGKRKCLQVSFRVISAAAFHESMILWDLQDHRRRSSFF